MHIIICTRKETCSQSVVFNLQVIIRSCMQLWILAHIGDAYFTTAKIVSSSAKGIEAKLKKVTGGTIGKGEIPMLFSIKNLRKRFCMHKKIWLDKSIHFLCNLWRISRHWAHLLHFFRKVCLRTRHLVFSQYSHSLIYKVKETEWG